MTTSSAIRLLTALAAIGKSNDVDELIDWIQATERDDIIRVYNRIRNQVRHLEVDVFDFERYSRPSRSTKGLMFVRDILRLQAESGLSAPAAASRIEHVLNEANLPQPLPAFSPKEGLQRWLTKVANLVGENLLLSAAIEAMGAPRSTSDWKLS